MSCWSESSLLIWSFYLHQLSFYPQKLYLFRGNTHGLSPSIGSKPHVMHISTSTICNSNLTHQSFHSSMSAGYLMEKADPVFINTYEDGAPLVFSLGTIPQAWDLPGASAATRGGSLVGSWLSTAAVLCCLGVPC